MRVLKTFLVRLARVLKQSSASDSDEQASKNEAHSAQIVVFFPPAQQ